jgi:DivIVA domain-containing protein
VNPEEIATREFPVVIRGYVRDEVQAFLASVADQIAARDARIARLDGELARLQKAAPATAPVKQQPETIDRGTLIRALGEEAAAILACADASAERMKAEAGMTAQRVRQDLQSIGSSLVDVHQLLGELVSLVNGLADGTVLASLAGSEVSLPEATAGDETAAGTEADGGGTQQEVRTVLGEVLGLTGQAGEEIQLPDETGTTGRHHPSP